MHLRSGSASTAQVMSGPPMPRMGFEPQRLRVFFGFPERQVIAHQRVRCVHRETWQISWLPMGS